MTINITVRPRSSLALTVRPHSSLALTFRPHSSIALQVPEGMQTDPIINIFGSTGAQGAYYDPSDLSTLFQDAAGTTPVTAVGQPVGLIKDKSGNGNDASQSTTASCPTLQQDSSGNYYLDFDGVDDSLNAPAAPLALTGALTVGVSIWVDPNFPSSSFITIGNIFRNSTSAYWALGIGSAQSGPPFTAQFAQNSAGVWTTPTGGSYGTGVLTKVGAIRQADGISMQTVLNGTVVKSAVANGAPDGAITVCDLGNGFSQSFQGRIYKSFVMGHAITPSQLGAYL